MKHPEQHYIILGQRGYGKTTLLLKIYHEIKKDKNLEMVLDRVTPLYKNRILT